MSMNKQFKVTFNVTATLSDSQENEFMEGLMEMAKSANRGKYYDNILVEALTYGPESALAQLIKQGLRASIKELAKECINTNADTLGMRFSPALVEVIR